MKVITKTGLVPVTSLKTGKTFGVTPGEVQSLLDRNQVILAPVPAGTETFDVPDPVVKADEDATKEKAKSTKEATAPAGPVDIPQDWETQHWMKTVKLATSIFGSDLPKDPNKRPTEVAAEIIRAEIQRRADAQARADAEAAAAAGDAT